jgi:hypothetical protein
MVRLGQKLTSRRSKLILRKGLAILVALDVLFSSFPAAVLAENLFIPGEEGMEVVAGEPIMGLSGEAENTTTSWVKDFLDKNPDYKNKEVVKKDKYSIHFKKDNGTIEAQFSGTPIHYQDESGNWQPIDTQIVASTDPDYDLMNITNDFKTYFNTDAYGEKNNVKFQKGDAWTTFRTVSSLKVKNTDKKDNKEIVEDDLTLDSIKPKNQNEKDDRKGAKNQEQLNKILYPKVHQKGNKQIDVNYTVKETRLQEEVILNEFMGFPEISQELTLNNTYVKQEGKKVNFYHKNTNELLWFIQEPFMYEQNNREVINTGLHYEINCNEQDKSIEQCNNLTLTKVFDEEGKAWLSDPARVYPVVIDPDYTTNIVDGGIIGVDADYATARVTSSTLDPNFPYVGQIDAGAGYAIYRTYIKFDTSSIPDGASISQTNLNIAVSWVEVSDDFDVYVTKLDWSNQDPLDDTNRETVYDNALSADNDAFLLNTVDVSQGSYYTSGNLDTTRVSKTASTYYGIRSANDKAGITPTGTDRLGFISASDAGAPFHHPYLTVIYAEAPEGGSSDSSTATAYPFQRKTWYDGTRYWKSFNANSRIEFWYSTDGSNWTENTSARIAVNTNDFSIEADSSNAFIAYTNGYDIETRKASSYPGTGFSWGTATVAYNGSSETDAYSYPSITRDSDNKVWIQSRHYGSVASPYLYTYQNNDFNFLSDFIPDATSKGKEYLHFTDITDKVDVIDGEVWLKITEELEETAYLDRVFLRVDGNDQNIIEIDSITDGERDLLLEKDGQYLVMPKGAVHHLKFNVPESYSKLEFAAEGYYKKGGVEKTDKTYNSKPQVKKDLSKLEVKQDNNKYKLKTLTGDDVEIGTEDNSGKKPYLELNKWGEETFFKVGMPFETGETPKSVENGKVKYSTEDADQSLLDKLLGKKSPKIEVDFYSKQPEEIIERDSQGIERTYTVNDEGGVEFDTILYEKPETNSIDYPIETKGLTFYYQPPLNQENQKEGITCTETTCYDKDGKVTSFRPESVVGSYAVYHESKQGDFSKSGGQNYKTGKAFHVYRPKVTDASGKETWGTLNIDDQNRTLTVTVDQDWLNTATYPVTIDPIFGYDGGPSSMTDFYELIAGSIFDMPENGTVSSVSFAKTGPGGNTAYKAGIYLHSDLSFIAGSNETADDGFDWQELNLTTTPSLVSGTTYLLVAWNKNNVGRHYFSYDTGSANQGHEKSQAWGSFPDHLVSPTHNSNKYCIYATYTASAETYNTKVIQSSSANSISAFGAASTLDSSANENKYGSLVSLGSGNMYSVWMDGTTLEGKKYVGVGTTGWAGSADSIGTGVTGMSNGLSLVSDSSGNAHLAYIGVGGSALYQEYTSSWQSAVTLDSNAGNEYPGIAVDGAGSNGVYAFWIRGDDIFYRRSCDYSTWDSPGTLEDSGTNDWLSVGSEDFGSGKIFATWTSGSGSPYTIAWESITPTACVTNADPTNDSLTFTNPTSGNIAIGDSATDWNFRAVVSDSDGFANLDTVKLRLADSTDNSAPYGDLEFTWTQATGLFSETGSDSLSAASLGVGTTSCSGNSCTLNFKIKFGDSFAAKDTNYSAQLYTTDDVSATDEDSYSNFYQVTAPNYEPTNDSLTFTNPDSSNIAIADGTTEWNFRAVVSDADGFEDLETVLLRLADSTDNSAPYGDLEFTWTQSTSTFSETGTDTLSAASLGVGTTSCTGNTCTLDFKVKFSDNFTAKATNYAAQLYTTDDNSATDEDTYSNIYQVAAESVVSSGATAYPFQNKTWYDGTRYWKAFNANSRIEFWYSSDGSSWTENTSARIAVDTNDFSIEADSSNAFIAYTNDGDIATRKASSYPGTGFSWGSATAALEGSAGGGGDWYNGSWSYRLPISVANSSGSDLTDFQVSIGVGTSALVAAGKMQSDCDDIRVTDANGTLLPHWIEENNPGCNFASGDTKIWVKASSIPTTGATLYVYYGNSDADNVENGSSVFEFFDNFNSGTIDTNKWTVGGSMTQSGGVASGVNSGTDYLFGKTRININTSTIMRMRNKSSSSYSARPGVLQSHGNPYSIPGFGWQDYQDGYRYTDTYETGVNQQKWGQFGTSWYTLESAWQAASVKFWVNGNLLANHTTQIPASSRVLYGQVEGNAEYDYFFTRKYVATEPITSLSTEESVPTGSYSYPSIIRDSNNKVWITAVNDSGSSYDFAAIQSNSANDISSFGTASTLDSSSNENKYGSLVSLGSGNMYSVWMDGTAIEGKKFNGSSWEENVTSIGTGKTGLSNGISLVSDTSGSAHLTYIDSSGYVKYQKYTSSWQSAVVLDSNVGNEYPSISYDNVNKALYAFWIRGDDIFYKKSCSPYATWGQVQTLVDSGVNDWLTTSIKDFGTGKVFALWTSGSSSPYTTSWGSVATTLCEITSDSGSATASPFQRKTWHDDTRYWVAFNANSRIEFWYSTDGSSWIENASARIAVDTSDFSIEADSANAFIAYTNGYDIEAREASSYPGAGFGWGEAAVVYNGSSNDDKYAYPAITKDSSGKLWVTATQTGSSASPFLYLYLDGEYRKLTDFIPDADSKDKEYLQYLDVTPTGLVDGKVKLKITEELEETTYLNRLYLRVDGNQIIEPVISNLNYCVTPSLTEEVDEQYLVMNQGDGYTVEFSVPGSYSRLELGVQGYYLVKNKVPAELEILNLYSHPKQGEDWVVRFETKGKSDLRISPADQATVVDDEFVSLACDGILKEPQILEGDVIFYPGWECEGIGEMVHKTLKEGKHNLRFEFGSQVVYAHNDTWDIAHTWDTGDVNIRTSWFTGVFDRNHDGSPYILAPIPQGARAYDKDGKLQWSYSGMNKGYDLKDIAVGNLNGTGYNDTIVIAAGWATYVGKVAIVDKDGNELEELIDTDFSAAVNVANRVLVDGTDIYIGTNNGLFKFIKSGSDWVESWYKAIGIIRDMEIADVGNGKRIFASSSTDANGLYCYQTDGTQDWAAASPGGYDGHVEIGKTDSSKTGDQILLAYQGGIRIYDKDGNVSASITTGSNVRTGLTLYDNDDDGEDEIYYMDMGRDMYCFERTGTDTYSQKYSVLDFLNASKYAGLEHFDLNGDGDDEIIAGSNDGYVYIYDKTLATQMKALNIGHGGVGSFDTSSYMARTGIQFVDTSGDGHEDMVIPGTLGYIDVYETSGFVADTGYSYSQAITIDHTKVSGGADINNFVLVIKGTYDFLKTVANGGNVNNTYGYDIIFTSDSEGTTKLDHEIVSYNASTGAVVFKVRIPTLHYNSDDVIYMHYGNAAINSSQESINSVWAAAYKGVWNLEENVAFGMEGYDDRTSNNHDGTSAGTQGPSQVDGQMGKAQSFDGNDYINFAGDGKFITDAQGTISTWIYHNLSATGSIFTLGSESNNVWRFRVVNSGGNYYISYYERGVVELRGSTALSPNTWYRVSMASDGSTTKFYVNGQLETVTVISGSNNGNWVGDVTASGTARMRIGMGYRWGASEEWFTGRIDDLHITDTELSAGQLLTEYNNQSSPSTFYTIGESNNDPTNDSLTFTNPNGGSGNSAIADNSTDWNFRAVVSDADGFTDLSTVILRLADNADNSTPYTDLEFTWTEATNNFSETGADTLSVASLGTGTTSCSGNTCTIDFKVKFNSAFATKDTNYTAQLYSTDDSDGTDEDSYSNFYQVTQAYLIKAVQSSSANDIFAWGGATILDSSANANKYGAVAARTSDNVLAAWIDGTSIESKNYNGSSWDANAASVGIGLTGLANSISLATDSSGYGHLAYIDSSGKTMYREYTSSWQSAVEIDSNAGNQYPGIAIDKSGYDGVYAFWIRNDDIFYRNACSPFTEWGEAQTLENSGTNDWLTVGIQDYSSGKLFALWTAGSGSPYTMSWKAITPTSCAANKAPLAPQTPYANNESAQSGQGSPVSGLTDHTPAFSAIFDDEDTSDTATNYQIQVGSDSDWATAEMWDSTKTVLSPACNEGARCADIIYNSVNALEDGTTYYWRIKFWDNSDAEGAWSETQQFSMNDSPDVTSLLVNGGVNLQPIEGSTAPVSWSATITDSNDCSGISSAIGKLYRSGVAGAQACTANNNNCYADLSCSLGTCSGSSRTVTCTANIQFHAEPTDVGSTYEAQYWQGWIEVTDGYGEVGEGLGEVDSVDLNSLVAMAVDEEIYYGSLLPGDSTSNKQTSITNTGNFDLDIMVSGQDMCTDYPTCTGHMITAVNQQYSLTSFDYGEGESLSGTEARVQVNLTKPTASPSNSSGTIYWGITIPSIKETGVYTGSNNILATADDGV